MLKSWKILRNFRFILQKGSYRSSSFGIFLPFRIRNCYSALYCSTYLSKFVTYNAMLEKFAASALDSKHAKGLSNTSKLQNYFVEGQLQNPPFWYFSPFRFRDCYSFLYCSTQLSKLVTHNDRLKMFKARVLDSTHANGLGKYQTFQNYSVGSQLQIPRFGNFHQVRFRDSFSALYCSN